MRLIDADELFEEMQRQAKSDKMSVGESLTMTRASYMVDAAPTVPQWHRCEDEMPSESGFYLVYDGTHFPVYLNYTKRKGKFDYSFSIDEPLYWMPLPELPEEDENGNC